MALSIHCLFLVPPFSTTEGPLFPFPLPEHLFHFPNEASRLSVLQPKSHQLYFEGVDKRGRSEDWDPW